MSHRALQRALVVALHDPGWLDGDLAPFDQTLTAAETAELRALDRRALATDPLRTRRLLRTLTEEYKASTTLALATTRRLSALDGFVRSTPFRLAVAQDRPLALAFGDFLTDIVPPAARPLLAIEHARARARRPEDPSGAGSGTRLAPGVVPLAVPAGSLDALQAVERWLFEVGLMPQALLCDDGPVLPPMPPAGAGPAQHLLFTPGEADVVLAEIDAGLYAVLEFFLKPRSHTDMKVGLTDLGLPVTTLDTLVATMVREGLLRP